MKWFYKKRKKLNNKGMSLVEVLIAIIILGIVVAPVLKAFVMSITMNAKAKEKQRQTTASQSIMEGFKAYDVEDICRQFNGLDSFNIVANYTNFYEIEHDVTKKLYNADGTPQLNPDGTQKTVIITQKSTPAGTGDAKTFTGTEDFTYEYAIEGMNYEGTSYDAKIVVTPLQSADVSVISNTAVITSVDANTTAQYDQSLTMDSNFAAKLHDFVPGMFYWFPSDMTEAEKQVVYQKVLDNFVEITEKNITIQATYNASSGYQVKVYTVYAVKLKSGTTTYNSTNGYIATLNVQARDLWYAYSADTDEFKQLGWYNKQVWDAMSGVAVPEVVYPSASTINNFNLEEIQLCYFPAYNYASIHEVGTGISVKKENIYFDNATTKTLDFEIVKQTRHGVTNLRTLEVAYMMDVNASTTGSVNMTSNLSENLADAATGGGGSLITKKEDVLLYSVDVYLYPEGTALAGFPSTTSELLKFSGTMND